MELLAKVYFVFFILFWASLFMMGLALARIDHSPRNLGNDLGPLDSFLEKYDAYAAFTCFVSFVVMWIVATLVCFSVLI